MKEHICRIAITIFSISIIFFMIEREYRKGEVARQENLYFQIGEETIQTWEKDGVQYLFLPSFAAQEDVILTSYSPEFYVINQKKKVSRNESLKEIAKGQSIGCQFIESGKKFKLCILQSANIPALFVETQSGGLKELKENKEYVVSGTINAVNAQGEWEGKKGLKSMGGRGNTSFAGYEKKPFSITLNEAASVLGLPAGQKYALISNASDLSLVRNDIARKMEMALGLRYSHEGRFVDLYINGEYEGNYYLCDDIEIGQERVNVSNMEAVMDLFYRNRNYESKEVYATDTVKARKITVNPKDITGGYLIEREYSQRFEYEYPEIDSAFITDSKEHFVVKSPRYCSVEQIEYIRRYVNEAEEAILSPDGKNAKTGKYYEAYIDVDSFVKKYLVEEVTKNYDAGVSSSYFYKDSDLKGGKLCAGPGWDYDMSMGNYVEWMEEFSADPAGISELAFHTYASSWYTELYQKPEFYEAVESFYWKAVEPFLDKLLTEGIAAYEERLEASAKMNEIRWKDELEKNPYYENRKQTFKELKEFLEARKSYLDAAWEWKEADL